MSVEVWRREITFDWGDQIWTGPQYSEMNYYSKWVSLITWLLNLGSLGKQEAALAGNLFVPWQLCHLEEGDLLGSPLLPLHKLQMSRPSLSHSDCRWDELCQLASMFLSQISATKFWLPIKRRPISPTRQLLKAKQRSSFWCGGFRESDK